MSILSVESFIAGFAYGGTTVLVGQPLETLKTLTQVQPSSNTTQKPSLVRTAADLYKQGGVRAFYRGGMPLLLGGGLMRSAQFGFYNSVLPALESKYGPTPKSSYYLGCINPHVVIAGWVGGMGRGMVEGPFEMVKVRRQIVSAWAYKDIFQGFGTTMLRNSFLFSSFVMYMDILKQQLGQYNTTLTPFITAGICANLAWITVWPIDVVKTRRQSGKYNGKSVLWIISDALKKGDMYRGLSVGMVRSFIANGASMEVYTIVERELRRNFRGE